MGVQALSNNFTRGVRTDSPFSKERSSPSIKPEPRQDFSLKNLKKEIEPLERKLISKLKILDFFKPKALFGKLLSKNLYPFRGVSRNKLDASFTKIARRGLPIEKKLVSTNDGLDLEFWFARNPNPSARTKLYFHGNASDIRTFEQEAVEDYNAGYNVCLLSYRGYSRNPGAPSEEGLIDDIDSVIEQLVKKEKIQTSEMDIEAHSLGCAIALGAISKRLSRNPNESFGDIVLLSPFKSIRDLVKDKLVIIPRFFINWLTNIWNNHEAIPKLKGKVKSIKFLHGDKDMVIPIEHSEDLYKQALRVGIKSEFVEIEDINHTSIRRDMK
jgi:uncharacterized protein